MTIGFSGIGRPVHVSASLPDGTPLANWERDECGNRVVTLNGADLQRPSHAEHPVEIDVELTGGIEIHDGDSQPVTVFTQKRVIELLAQMRASTMRKAAAMILAAASTGCASSNFTNEVYPGSGDNALFVSWYYSIGVAVRAKIVKAEPAAAAASAAN